MGVAPRLDMGLPDLLAFIGLLMAALVMVVRIGRARVDRAGTATLELRRRSRVVAMLPWALPPVVLVLGLLLPGVAT